MIPPGASTSTENPVFAVGIGPGDPAYLHRRARSILDDADVVVGFDTVIDCVRRVIGGEVLACRYETEAAQLSAFADRIDRGNRGAAVLMGDPNVSGYTFVEKVEEAIGRSVRVVPGVSSIQIAASRSRIPLEASVVVTLHRRGELGPELDRVVAEAGDHHLLILPRPYDYMPEQIAAVLVDRGVDPTLKTAVYERLTFDDERVTRGSLGDLATAVGSGESAFSDLSVLVVRRA